MTDFKAKMHKIRFRLGLRPRPRWGSLQRPRPPCWIWGPLRVRGRGWAGEEEGKGKEREVEGRERFEGPKFLSNQGPSETCYATGVEACFYESATPTSQRGGTSDFLKCLGPYISVNDEISVRV